MISRLSVNDIEEILALQRECLKNKDMFLPTSVEGYMRGFAFNNFCLGYRDGASAELVAFLNCSLPTARSPMNLGRNRLNCDELDYVGHMNTLLVRKGRRHSGIGRELVCAALYTFAEAGCRHIYVTADPRNAPSVNLLFSMGFERAGEIVIQGHDRNLFYLFIGGE